MAQMATTRSWLFAPGDSERKLVKAATAGADAIIVDLEDAVAPDYKPVARTLARNWLEVHRRQVTEGRQASHWVRINSLQTDWWREDLAAVVPAAPYGIVLPKASGPEDVRILGAEIYELEQRHGIPANSTRILPLVSETPTAALTIADYAGAPMARLAGLTWGAEDLSAALGARRKRDDAGQWTDAFRLVRATVLITARAAGVEPVDTLYADFRDLEGLAKAAAEARADGFAGMLAIHPAQVPVINAAFSPHEEELAEARAIVGLFAANPGAGALALDGRMVDLPHLAQARRLLGLTS